MLVIIVGAVAIPETSSAPASSTSDPVRDAASSGRVSSTAMAARHHR